MTTTEIRALMAAVKRKEISERDIVPLCWRDGDRSKAYRKALAACFNSAEELLDKADKWDAECSHQAQEHNRLAEAAKAND